MKNVPGAGAATAAGTNYQSRVAAYLLATSLCEMPPDIYSGKSVEYMILESREPTDDINLAFSGGGSAFVQVKTNISYSTTAKSTLYSVLDQYRYPMP